MKLKSLLFTALCGALTLLCNRAEATKIYVDISATGLNNGTSWTNAYLNLQSALIPSVSNDSIFVAMGSYKPDGASPGNRSLSFNMKTGVVVLGGFPTGGGTLANRNWETNPTILTGDIGIVGTHTDNSYHVVRCAGQQGELNGFIVERGRADAAAPDNDGGGAFITSGYLLSRFCTYRFNVANDQGGGTYHDAGGNPQYRQCKFEGNTAAFGGGSYAFASTFIMNCTYYNNTATTNGGGVYAVVNINMYNNTFKNNSATTSGNAIYYQSGGSNRLYNSIVWGNTGSATHINGVGSITIRSSIVQGGCPGGGATCLSVMNLDPLFTDLTGHISTSSPAIDAGENATGDGNSDALTIDHDNNNRNFDAIPGGVTRDMGAYESQVANLSRYYVDHTATGANDGTSWVNAFTSFQSAVAIAASGDTVLVAAGTHKPSVGTGRLKKYTLVNGVCYYGGFPNGGGTAASRDFNLNRTILSGDIGTVNDSIDNCFVVIDATNLTNTTLMSGFTVEKGNADSSGTGNIYNRAGGIHLGPTGNIRLDSVTVRTNFGKTGSGIYAEGPVNWVLRGCIFENNGNASAISIGGNASGSFTNCTFNNNLGFNGGAISLNVLSATFSFTNCNFTNNRSTASGGGGAINSGQTAGTYTNCMFVNNTALTGPGGALYKFYSTANTFTNCTFQGNRAAGGGGALYGQGGFNLYQCVFSQNLVTNASQHGGAIYNNGTPSIATNCVFWSNSTTVGLGGGIYNNTGGTFTLTNCTFAKNHALGFNQGGGINNNSNSNATVSNCIFWGNLANNNDVPSNSEIGHGSGTLNVTNTIWQGNVTGGTIYNIDPRFTNSLIGDLTLTMCSPAIDTATSAGAPAIDVVNNARPFDAKPGGLTYDLGAYEFQTLVLLPEINVKGNNVSILSGDVSPSVLDFTDFGTMSVCNGTISQTFVIENTGNGNLSLSNLTITGANASDFTIQTAPAASVVASGNTSFVILFNPSATGLRTATITITNNDCDEPIYTFSIQGTGSTVIASATLGSNVSCFGGSNGSASSSFSGGVGPYTYLWAPSGGNASTTTGRPAGNYTVTITDANSCSSSATVSITQPTSPVSGTTVVTNVSCFGGSNGAINLTPTGGTGPYTFNWLPSGPITEDRTGLVAGTYSVQVTDVNGCTGTITATVTQPTSPVSGTTVVTNVSCFGGSNGAINLTPTGGTGPYTFNWLPSGPTTEDRTGLVTGTYTVIITDNLGCTGTVTATVTQPTSPVSGTTVVTNVSCFGGSNGAINLTPTGGTGPYTFNWLPSGPTTEDRTGLVAGTYSVQVTDLNGCTGTITATVTQPTSPVSGTTVVTNVSCFGGSNGAINLTPTGGTGPYTFNWLPSGPTTEDRTGLVAGTYTVQITDLNGCTGTVTTTVTQPTSPVSGTTVVTNVSCFGGSNGAINLTPTGGTGPYTFNWLPSGPTTEDRTGLVAGTYTVQITDLNGCTGTVTATVTQPTSPVSGTTVVTNVSCFGGSNGVINLTPTGGTGPYTFNWLPSGPTTEDRTGLVAGTYSVQVTDINGCTGTITATVTQPTSPVSGTTVVTNVSCFGGSNGAINLTPTGGTGPYTFNWLPSGPTTEDRTGLVAGTYTVQITDINGCTSTVTTSVTQPPTPVSGTTVVTNVSCFGGSNGAINLTPTGGTGPYTFNWLPSGPTTEDRTGLVAGTYTVQITDINGCTSTVTASVTQPPTPVSGTTVVTNVSCFGGSNGAINLTPTGGTGPYTFNWLPSGPTTEDRTGLIAGTYTVQITDLNGCTGTVTTTVTQPPVITLTGIQTNVSCNAGTNGSATIFAAGGTGAFTYLWSSGGNAATETNLAAGTYTVVVSDANSCIVTQSFLITEPTAITFTSSQTDVLCNGDTSGTATVTAIGGSGALSYVWTSGGTSAMETGLAIGNYSVVITDTNSCSATATFTITEPTAISYSSIQTDVSCNGGNNGSASVFASGGTGTLTYLWSTGGTASMETGFSIGTYTVTITDANLCNTTATFLITEPTAITFTSSQTDVLCNSGNSGTATVVASGGTGAFTYAWSSGGTAAMETGLTQGNYSVVITDANSCSTTATFTITEPNAITFTQMQTNVSCNGGTNGDAMVMASGGTGVLTYAWSSGGTAATESGLTQGNYSVVITDANSCSTTATFTITEPTAITFTQMQTNVSCFGGTNGDAMVMANGGTGALTYAWSSGGTAAMETGLTQGNYSVTITDANSCSTIATFTITEPTVLASSITSSTNPTTCSGTDGAIDITVSGGTASYNYLWSNGATTEDLSAIPAGSYSVTITDANGCTTTSNAIINDPGAPTVTVSLPIDTACGSFPGLVALGGESPSGGTWSGTTVSGTDFDPFTAGVGTHFITYTFTDVNGCTASAIDSIYVDLCIGIETIATTEWNLFPNPTNGAINITTSDAVNTDVIIEVYSLDGKMIHTENKQNTKTMIIDLSTEPVGVYFIRITANDKVSMHKVVKM